MGAAVPDSDLPSNIVPADDLPTDTPDTGLMGGVKAFGKATAATAELAAHYGSQAVAQLGGGLNYLGTLAATGGDTDAAKAVQNATVDKLTYAPRTDAAQGVSAGVDKALSSTVGAGIQKASDVAADVGGPLAGAATRTTLEGLPYVLGAGPEMSAARAGVGAAERTASGAVSRITSAAEAPTGVTYDAAGNAVTPPAIVNAAQAAANKVATGGNAGAAGAAVDTTKLLPETQAELARIDSSNGTVNPTALSRVSDAESLPVPVKLTAGQARGDAGMVSEEFNLKGEDNNAIGNRYDEQDQALRDNLATMHRDAAPDTVANNNIQNGQAMVDSLKRYDEPKVAATNAAYQAAKDANGGNLQMDGTGFASAAETALKPQGRARSLPAAAQGIIDDVKASGGQMSLDDFEGYRTTLANEVRKAQQAGDGNAVAAIGKVRDALENVQPIGASAAAKALYDNARNMARARFAELDADPAYKAAVEDDTPVGQQSDLADKFTDKYVMGGSQAALQRLRPKLDAEGSQAMTSATMNFLQNKAGINLDSGVGKFSNAGYNSGVAKVMPRAKELLGDQDLVDNVRKLGNVSNYVQGISRGGYANTSHTFVAAAKEMLGKAADIGEHGLNVAAHGLPLGTVIRKFSAGRSRVAAAREALKAGAGLED
jgi:hypothetical protein